MIENKDANLQGDSRDRLVAEVCKRQRGGTRWRTHARLLLRLLAEGRFPQIWIPSGEEKDLRQLLIHRYKLVRLPAQVKNELQHLAMNQGMTKKRRLSSKAGEKVLRDSVAALGEPAARRPV